MWVQTGFLLSVATPGGAIRGCNLCVRCCRLKCPPVAFSIGHRCPAFRSHYENSVGRHFFPPPHNETCWWRKGWSKGGERSVAHGDWTVTAWAPHRFAGYWLWSRVSGPGPNLCCGEHIEIELLDTWTSVREGCGFDYTPTNQRCHNLISNKKSEYEQFVCDFRFMMRFLLCFQILFK